MRRSSLLLCALTALAAACGSQTVGPSPDDASVTLDGSLPPVDAPNPPPRVDGATPDAPTPPPDAAPPLRDLCARACDRAARDCGRVDTSCASGCNSTLAMLPPACTMRFVALVECLVSNGFTCGATGSAQPAAACRPLLDEVQRCAGGMPPPPPPPPPPVDGGVEGVYPGCPAACDQIARACGAPMGDCVTNCSSTGFEARTACPGTFDEFLTCIDRNRFTCVDGNPTPPAACAAISMRLEACLNGGGGSDEPPVPPTADAGVSPPDV